MTSRRLFGGLSHLHVWFRFLGAFHIWRSATRQHSVVNNSKAIRGFLRIILSVWPHIFHGEIFNDCVFRLCFEMWNAFRPLKTLLIVDGCDKQGCKVDVSELARNQTKTICHGLHIYKWCVHVTTCSRHLIRMHFPLNTSVLLSQPFLISD